VTRPLIVGIGGTTRPESGTEKALVQALAAAEAQGAQTPTEAPPTPEQNELADAVRQADGVIVASPGYHGSISGLIKNALDSLELLRGDPRPYFQGRPVGCIITADGWQAAGTTLMALRSIIHALRGWPTPFGAALNSTTSLFDDEGRCREPKDAWQLATVADQVMEFARMRAAT
jgi:FMN reductase